MRDEAEETERRCTEVADSRDRKKTAILEKAQETKTEATEMMSNYLTGGIASFPLIGLTHQ